MKTINFSKIVCAGLGKFFSIIGLTGVILLGLSGCSTEFDAPATEKDQPVTKDYNYLFKVIVPEEIMRSMTDGEHQQMIAKIEKMGGILNKQIDSRYRNVEDMTMTPASVGAVIFVSEDLRDTAEELISDGATVLFSYDEFMADNGLSSEIKDEIQNSERSVSVPERVFIYNGQNNPRDNEAWKSGQVQSRGVGDEGPNTDVNAVASDTNSVANNPEVMAVFLENFVDNVASNPVVSMTVQDLPQTDNVSRSVEDQGTTVVFLKADSSEMTVELENVTASDVRAMQRSVQDENERIWFNRNMKNIWFNIGIVVEVDE